MIYKSELAVDCTAGYKLGGLDVNVFRGLVGDVGVEAAHRHQAVQAGRLLVRGVALRVQLAARPGPHVPGAVEGAVPVGLCGQKQRVRR